MKAQVTWQKDLVFAGTTHSDFQLPFDGAPDAGAENESVRPLELLLTGLAGCTAMDVISILQKKRQTVTAFQVLAHADRASEHPKVFTHIVLEYIVTGHDIEREAAERAVELSATKYCPVFNMLNKAASIETKITVLEADK